MKTIIKYTSDTESLSTTVFIHQLDDDDRKRFDTTAEYFASVSFAGVDTPDSYHDSFDCLVMAQGWAKAQL